MNLFDLMAKITLDTSEYESKLSESEDKGKSFGNSIKKGFATAGKIGAAAVGAIAVGTAALGTAMVNGAGKVASYGDNIDKMSQKMGISAQAYQEWDAILQHSGSSVDSMQRGMITLAKAAETGSDSFQKLGLSQEQIASMSREDLFAATIQGLQGMEEGTERAVLAQQLLGGAAKELGPLLNTSAEETEAMRQRVHELGGVMSDEAVKAAAAYQDSLQDMSTSFDGLKRNLFSSFMPGITEVMNGLTDIFSGDSDTGVGKVSSGISNLIQKISEGMPKLLQVGGEIVRGLAKAIMDNLPTILSEGAAILKELAMGIVQSLPELVKTGLEIIVELSNSIAEAIPELVPVIVEVITTIAQILTDPGNIMQLLQAAVAIITALAEGLITALPQLIGKIPEIVQNLVAAIIEAAPYLMQAGKSLISKLWDGIKTSFSLLVQAGKESVEIIKSGFGPAFESFKGFVTSKFASMKEKITAPFETAREKIRGIVDKIKSVFDFSWSLPKIKLPHFSVGSGPSVLGINLPTISVQWYKKAYEDPFLFNSPTVMATAGGLKGFGDGSGGEIVYGRDQLMRDIREAVGGVVIKPEFKLYLDGDTLVGGTSERMDGSLGQMQAYQLRWEGAV